MFLVFRIISIFSWTLLGFSSNFYLTKLSLRSPLFSKFSLDETDGTRLLLIHLSTIQLLIGMIIFWIEIIDFYFQPQIQSLVTFICSRLEFYFGSIRRQRWYMAFSLMYWKIFTVIQCGTKNDIRVPKKNEFKFLSRLSCLFIARCVGKQAQEMQCDQVIYYSNASALHLFIP